MFVKWKLTFGVKRAVTAILTSLLSLAGSSRGQMKVPEPLSGRIGLCCQLGGSPAFFLTKKYFLSANYDKSLTTKLVLL